MKRSTIFLLIPVIVIVVLFGWTMKAYNNMVGNKVGVDTAWANVQTQYQRRFDLYPNLEKITANAANFESSVLTQVVAARSAWAKASQESKVSGDRSEEMAAMKQFDSSFSRLLVTVEAYPNLTATQSFIQLSTEITGTENRIRNARDEFNTAVGKYNVYVKTFPNMIIASIFNFTAQTPFQADTGAEKAPKIQDLNLNPNAAGTK